MNEDKVCCTYKHCRCESRDIPLTEAIKICKAVYHEVCLNEWNHIKEIKKVYYENISKTVVQSVLGRVINDIIYGKNIDAEYLLFALNYALSHNYKINSPYGLHYIIDDYKIKNQWKLDKNRKILNQNKNIEIIKTEDTPFSFNPTKQKGFNDIIKE